MPSKVDKMRVSASPPPPVPPPRCALPVACRVARGAPAGPLGRAARGPPPARPSLPLPPRWPTTLLLRPPPRLWSARTAPTALPRPRGASQAAGAVVSVVSASPRPWPCPSPPPPHARAGGRSGGPPGPMHLRIALVGTVVGRGRAQQQIGVRDLHCNVT